MQIAISTIIPMVKQVLELDFNNFYILPEFFSIAAVFLSIP